MCNVIPTEKMCTRCGQVLPLTRFYKSKLGRYGRESRCIACESTLSNQKYHKKKEAVYSGLSSAGVLPVDKRCNMCQQQLPISQFYKHRVSSDEHHATCITCIRQYATKYREKQRNKVKLVVTSKTCAKCSRVLPVRLFYKNVNSLDGFHCYCKECQRQAYLSSVYGVSAKDVENLIIAQSGRCAICGTPRYKLTQEFSVDHDHNTNKVRGLLCPACNTLLGHARDNTDILTYAITYLQRFRD